MQGPSHAAPPTLLTVVGARPQFVKAATIARALARRPGTRHVLVHTGQHHDRAMSEIFFEQLGMPEPDHHLGVSGGRHGAMTGRMLERLEPVMEIERPDLVIVYGDTNSTLAGALVAAKLHLPIAHVEAGLRSFNRAMPEEVNRIVADHLSSLHFCPTHAAVANLAKEGVFREVHHVGDVMYDATLDASERAAGLRSAPAELDLEAGGFALATLHRAENTEDPARLASLLRWLDAHARDVPVLLPLHPRTSDAVARAGIKTERIRFIEPVGYLEMHALLSACSVVLTDSGGLQKEAYFHRKPCVTLRDETEWVETIAHGWNRLWTVPDYLPRAEIAEYGDGRASEAIAAIMCDFIEKRRGKQSAC